MTTITFDTLHLVDKLKSAGIPEDQLVTKDDLKSALDDVINPIKIDLAILKTDSLAIKWMMGILIAGVMSIVIKTFFS